MSPTAAIVFSNYANLLLIIATAFYVAHVVGRSQLVGWLATCCAYLGVAGLIISLIGQWLHPLSPSTVFNLSFILSLFNAITVLTYLIMEKWYGTKTAAAFVMPIVATAVIFQILGGTTSSITSDSIWLMWQQTGMRMYKLCVLSFVCTFAWAACCAVIYLWRAHFQRLMFARRTLDQVEQNMYQAIAVGFPLYTGALILGVLFSGMTFVDDWARYLHTLNLAIIWSFYFIYRLLQRQFHWRGRFMAKCSILGLCLCVLLLPEVRDSYALLH